MKLSSMIAVAAVALATSTSFAQVAEPDFLSSCKVSFPNGMEDTAKCVGLIAVLDSKNKLQCAPRANLIKKEGKVFFLKNPVDKGEPVTPCKDGMKVSG